VSLVPERTRRRAEVSIVPLVDVLIALLFFFLVSMQFRDLQTLNITLPEIQTAGENQLADQLEISVTSEGEFRFNGEMLNEDELRVALQVAADVDRRIPVLLMADEEAAFKHVTLVMDLCRQFGLNEVRVQSR